MMKRASFTLAVITICVEAFAQQPLHDAVNNIKATKGYISRGVSSENLRDSRDSLCTISITDFQIQGKGNSARMEKVTDKMISQILACYEVEAVNSTSSHSYVIPSDSTSLPGFKNVKLYYAEGKEPYKSESGHSYVSVRNDFGADGYRLATCIEWWKNAEKEFLGRIVEVRGPFSADVYKKGRGAGIVIQTPPLSPTWHRDARDLVSEIGELANMWKSSDDSTRKIALEESINERIQSIWGLVSCHDNDSSRVIITRMFRALSPVDSYKVKVRAQYNSGKSQEWDMPVRRLANAYQDMDVWNLGVRYAERLIHVDVKLNSRDKEGPSLNRPRISCVSPKTYTDFPTVSYAVEDGDEYSNCAIWTTADSTYVVRTYYIPDNHTQIVQNPNCYIRDIRKGDIYYKIRNDGISDEWEFFVDSMEGKTIAITEVYPSIPISCTCVDIEPAFAVRGHEEDMKRLEKARIEDLQSKQKHFTSTPTIVLNEDQDLHISPARRVVYATQEEIEASDRLYEVLLGDESGLLASIEIKPTFQGGDASAFAAWVNSQLVYPEIAKENGVQGEVKLRFTVMKDGSVGDVKVLKGVDISLDREAVRVVKSSPKWTPAEHKGEKVKVTYTFPVVFMLTDSEE